VTPNDVVKKQIARTATRKLSELRLMQRYVQVVAPHPSNTGIIGPSLSKWAVRLSGV